VFLGNPSARVRDELWKVATQRANGGCVLQIWSERSPQGFRYRSHGPSERELVEFEGVTLVRRRSACVRES
jgi:CRISPR-associated protein Cas2